VAKESVFLSAPVCIVQLLPAISKAKSRRKEGISGHHEDCAPYLTSGK
jgi:hypothetical protein